MEQLNFKGTINGAEYLKRYLLSLIPMLGGIAVMVIPMFNKSIEYSVLFTMTGAGIAILGVIWSLSTEIKRFRALSKGTNPWLFFWGAFVIRLILTGVPILQTIFSVLVVVYLMVVDSNIINHQELKN